MAEKDTDCPDPICFKEDPLKSYQNKGKSSQKLQLTNKNDIFSDDTDEKDNKAEEVDHYKDCPNNRDSLGFYTWNFLHTMGVYYPSNPDEQLQGRTKAFFDGFSYLYPCKVCSAHFRKDLEKYPVPVQSNKDLSIWLCQRHNDVNKWKGKPIFDCSFENLEKRWKTGYSHCNDDDIFV